MRGAGISSYGNSNLVINGLKFEHSPEHSIRAVGPDAENIVVSNNHTYDTYKSGISIRGVTGNPDSGDYNNIRSVLVTGNLMELANNNGGAAKSSQSPAVPSTSMSRTTRAATAIRRSRMATRGSRSKRVFATRASSATSCTICPTRQSISME